MIGVDIVTAESIFGIEPTQLNRHFDSFTTERTILPETAAFIHSPLQSSGYYGNGKSLKNKKPASPTVSFPKYNNYVRNKNKFDKYTRVLLPLDLLGIAQGILFFIHVEILNIGWQILVEVARMVSEW